ncbi:MAG: NAD+ synthase [Bacteroidales bacterium]|nr:NAD+ synthase [Bacteroidales bacterium]
MKITLAQLNYHVGNFDRNSRLIIDTINQAENEGSDLVVFSELSLTGYPPHDLLEYREFIDNCNRYLEIIAGHCLSTGAIVGAPAINMGESGKKLFNAAWFLTDGKIKDVCFKSLLPTYDIFDEYRYFEPSTDFNIIEFKGKKLAVTICEDLWDEQDFDHDFASSRMYSISPMEELAKLHPDLIINISASPFAYTRTESKKEIFTAKAKSYRLPLIMVNQVGANTDLIFEGNSMVVGPNGNIISLFPDFREHTESFELDNIIAGDNNSFNKAGKISMIHDALVLGVKDYFDKMEFNSAIVGLSGGIDSALCLCIASEALGPSRVRALLMPSMYSSRHSVNDAVELCNNLKVSYDIINIEDDFRSIESSLSGIMKDMPADTTEENIQARIRCILLMAVSNKFGNILLNTSNKSETAVGYSTLYGDMAGSLSVLGDVYKTDIYRLARHINKKSEIIPINIINKAPSAELSPGQKDSDSLPDYDVLDSILYQYIEQQKPVRDIKGEKVSQELVHRIIDMINKNEYKRFQAPPILRISNKAFGHGRRMPLVAAW